MAVMPITDSAFLDAEGRERPMHVGGLHLYQPPEDAGPDFAGRMLAEALRSGEVSRRLTLRPSRIGGVGPWQWEADEHIDLEYHVRHSALPHPGRVRELLALVSRLHGTLLHRSRPLWETHVIEGLEDGRFALYTKMHHALVDGVTSMKLLERSLSTDPDDPDPRAPWARMDPPSRDRPQGDAGGGPLGTVTGAIAGMAGGIAEGLRGVTGGSEAMLKSLWRSLSDHVEAFPYKAPRTMFNVAISGARRFAADDWPLERLEAVRTATGSTLNDVVLAVSAGALRRYLIDRDALPDQPLIAAVPVSLHGITGEKEGNNVGIILCNLGTHLDDPTARLQLIRESIQSGKDKLSGLNQTGILLMSALNFAPAGIMAPLFQFESLRRPPFNIVISNVPGPRQTLYLRGARLSGMYPMSIPVDGQAVNITVVTYDGRLGVGITGCRRSVPHLQRMLTHLEDSLVELERLV